MESLDSFPSEETEPPDPAQLLDLFVSVARARETARELSYERSIHRSRTHEPDGRIYEAVRQAEAGEQLARMALSKTIENRWVGRRVHISARRENMSIIQPTSHTQEYQSVSQIQGNIILHPGYENYPNVLAIQAHPGLPYYMTRVLDSQHQPLIDLRLVDEEPLA